MLLRSSDGNKSLLAKAAKPLLRKSVSAHAASENETEKDTILLKPSQSLDVNILENEDASFTFNSRQNEVNIRTKSFGGFSTFQKNAEEEPMSREVKQVAARKRNMEREDEKIIEWDTIEIALEKSSGKGLGIGVTGGPKSRIANGMTVGVTFTFLCITSPCFPSICIALFLLLFCNGFQALFGKPELGFERYIVFFVKRDWALCLTL